MLTTTLVAIRKHKPCESGWQKLLKHLGKTGADDTPLGFDVILASNGLNDALWCLRTADGGIVVARRFALACARHVEHLSDNPRAKACNDVTERYLDGKATKEELKAATDAAYAAAYDYAAAYAYATAAAKAAATAYAAATAAAADAAAATNAAYTADAAATADAAYAAYAYTAEGEWQGARYTELVTKGG